MGHVLGMLVTENDLEKSERNRSEIDNHVLWGREYCVE